ncbi:hypothetical protein [Priestia taiwanensis]|uniref:Uncharacterized protein n=1 Tax=Priestia taiwanensis TaxID=1347902 RepID=A0A917EM66_9BACI|nr:hypothetical protein [Priestia taiwanensis]MBM7362427.1 hypothetical protein [Priestia taiwanensis]GGE62161.1 hypothetical protein GCM10007140_10510 [Priestia taiwanensis]
MQRRYYTVPVEEPVGDLPEIDENGIPIYYLCFIGKDIIEDFHEKADGNDDLARQWAKNGVRHVIKYGLNTADYIYNRKFVRR